MTLNQLIELIIRSNQEDWSIIELGLPGYLNEFISNNRWLNEFEENGLHKGYSHVATYKSNLSVSMAWGKITKCIKHYTNDKYLREKEFGARLSTNDYLDLFFYGTLVFRISYTNVTIDHSKLPLPNVDNEGNLSIPRRHYYLFEKFSELSSELWLFKEDFKRYKADFTNDPWP